MDETDKSTEQTCLLIVCFPHIKAVILKIITVYYIPRFSRYLVYYVNRITPILFALNVFAFYT